MIYIDPPYNTGKDFLYKDNFTQKSADWKQQSGDYDEDGKRLVQNPESEARFHSNWLSMMYPRLKLARNLLKDDGVIFISIDDNEQANLKKLCDEVFGEDNFIACLPTIMNLKGNNDQFGFAGTHELTVVYIKNKEILSDLNGIPLNESDYSDYSESDALGEYKQGATLMRTGEEGAREKRPKGYYPIYVSKDLRKFSLSRISDEDFEVYPKTVSGKKMSWRRSPKKLAETLSEFTVKQTNNGISFYKKQRLADDKKKGKKPKTLFYKPEYSSGNGTAVLKKLFEGRIFDNPKPVSLISDFISVGLNCDDLILDFFAGSATTAHAVMQLNAEDGGKRKFIMVQLPEECNEESEAFKAEYKTIADIGKERIRRAGEKIKQENPKIAKELDIGFRVLKLDSSNMLDIYYTPNNLTQGALFKTTDNIKPERSNEDLLFHVLLDWGIDLTYPINKQTIAGIEVFFVAENSLVACFAKAGEIDDAFCKQLATRQPLRVVFRDAGFADNDVKINATQIFKQLSPNTEIRTI